MYKLLKKIKGIGKLAEKIESYFEKKAEETLQKAEKNKSKKERSATFYKKLGVFIFVAIPLPMTGVWTGTAVSVFLDMDFKKKAGFQRSIELSKEYGLYRQNYCGCVFSKREAELREENKR